MRIAVFSAHSYEIEAFEAANAAHGHEFVVLKERFDAAGVPAAEGCGGVCISVNDLADQAALEGLARLGIPILVTRSIGYDQIDLAAAERLGIVVARVPGYSPNSVSEFTLGLILTLTRKIHRAYLRTRESNFGLRGLVGSQLSDKTVGIVGAGQIGGLVVRALAGFGCRILIHDRQVRPELLALGAAVPLDQLLGGSDVIVLNVPLTPETRYLIDARAVQALKRGAIIVNTGRGALIDHRALVDGLKSGQVGGAALDVYEEEAGMFYADRSADILQDDVFCRLLTFPNVIITSHMAYLTDHALDDISRTVLAAFTAFERGEAVPTRLGPG